MGNDLRKTTMQKVHFATAFLEASSADGRRGTAGRRGGGGETLHSRLYERPPRPYRPSRAEVATSFGRQADYGEVTRQPVFKMRIEPHWFGDNTRFWYRNALAQGRREFILADAAKGVRAPAFDHARLAAALSRRPGTSMKVGRLPFDAIEFTNDAQAVRFTADGIGWSCDLTSYACARSRQMSRRLPQERPDRRRKRSVAQQSQAPLPTESGRRSFATTTFG